jgi:cellulose biosynthesis protein BcsQ
MAPKQPSRLHVVTLANTKGGVGKTTIASGLAVRAAEDSKRVALLDLDPPIRRRRFRVTHDP